MFISGQHSNEFNFISYKKQTPSLVRMLIFWFYTPHNRAMLERLTNFSEAIGPSKMLVNTSNNVLRINPEDKHTNLYHRENLKSCLVKFTFINKNDLKHFPHFI